MPKNDKSKTLGQVFTPDYIVDRILDEVGYTSGNILDKKIMEPAFGHGVFLIHIIERLIEECKKNNLTDLQIEKQLTNVYGIELDKDCFVVTENEMKQRFSGLSLKNINLLNMNTLDYKTEGEFNYVVGNPPYIRIHNLDEETRQKIKTANFAGGNTDLYIVFYELGLKMLKENGKLAYISPNSFIKNSSQGKFRKYLLENNLLRKIINFGSDVIFEDYDTYTCIALLDKDNKQEGFEYEEVGDGKTKFYTFYSKSDFKNLEKPWVLTTSEKKEFLAKIAKKKKKIEDNFNVQYGFATNLDRVYVSKSVEPLENGCSLFNGTPVENKLIHKAVKGAKYHGKNYNYILYPYWNGNVVSIEKMKEKFPKALEYFKMHEEALRARDMEPTAKEFYEYARSQGVKTCLNEKLVVNHVLTPGQEKIEVYLLPEDEFVYSGIFITGNSHEDLLKLKKILESKNFAKYCWLSGKDMSGGYKSINTKTIKDYRY